MANYTLLLLHCLCYAVAVAFVARDYAESIATIEIEPWCLPYIVNNKNEKSSQVHSCKIEPLFPFIVMRE